MHGEQSRDPDDALDPWTYYRRSGPVGDVFDALEIARHSFTTATSASWAWGPVPSPPTPSPGRRSPISRSTRPCGGSRKDPEYFTYLTNCQVTPQIRMGDARLTLAREPDGQFDVLLIDAFSSDAIPIHLLTRQAVEMYFQKLAPHGLLMVHLSNRHLRLGPVVAGTADDWASWPGVRDDDDENRTSASRRRRGPSWRERRRTWAGSRTTRTGNRSSPSPACRSGPTTTRASSA